MTTTKTTQTATTINLRCKAFAHEPAREHLIMVTDTEIRVWDEVAGYFTRHHSLMPSAQRKARQLAREARG